MSRHLSLVHATSAGYWRGWPSAVNHVRLAVSQILVQSITFANAIARVRETTRERKQSSLTQPIRFSCQK